MLRAIRRRLVAVRDELDRRMHPRRGAWVRRRLAELAPGSVLFVCLGNICRSPYAARVARARGGSTTAFESAGFIGPDRAPPENAVAVARRRGVDHADHRSKVVTPELLVGAGVTFVFDRYNLRRLRAARGARMDRVFMLGDLDPVWAGKRAIPDPWGKPVEEFDVVFERIDRCVGEALASLGGGVSDA